MQHYCPRDVLLFCFKKEIIRCGRKTILFSCIRINLFLQAIVIFYEGECILSFAFLWHVPATKKRNCGNLLLPHPSASCFFQRNFWWVFWQGVSKYVEQASLMKSKMKSRFLLQLQLLLVFYFSYIGIHPASWLKLFAFPKLFQSYDVTFLENHGSNWSVNLSQDFHVTYSGLYIAVTGFAGYTVSVESLTINCSELYSVQVSLIFILIAKFHWWIKRRCYIYWKFKTESPQCVTYVNFWWRNRLDGLHWCQPIFWGQQNSAAIVRGTQQRFPPKCIENTF